MEHAVNELVNEVNQSEHNNEDHFLNRQDIVNIVAQGIVNAIPAIAAAVTSPVEPSQAHPSKCTHDDTASNSINGGGNNNNGIQAPIHKRMKAATPGCTYKEFLACKPAEFAGNEGATAALRWLEKTEVVIKISKCAEEDKVMYASHLFKEEALEWWNTVLQAKGSDMAYAMSWEEFKRLIERKFCPEYEKEKMANKFLSHRMVDVDCRGYTSNSLSMPELYLLWLRQNRYLSLAIFGG
ncbi:putative retrotransposon gag domain-containing protein [Helianthus annuus]|uniref:Retrotransposon gag domain-containing protein n=1 Tax=Helianthus annuus TaxID=4232 RepID=A0A9K3E1Q4_HELAN|nr:putative retrotransposon gag domain-containing protein [Helianthus annuus]KAJ0451021.1 putative retrotransposon gag domain-containing protein [Helianthus annuus]KAJ0472882.1 putative retrotransposon gag domain-containing protein [Helianthus annuus]KAJ0648485.1 putative retrotransposon gag domain-containing protein [Helianthus annuus]KAJ0652315.1 putative retrotransposon gag domain-containing protein [Helianthus annuus]